MTREQVLAELSTLHDDVKALQEMIGDTIDKLQDEDRGLIEETTAQLPFITARIGTHLTDIYTYDHTRLQEAIQ